MFRKIIFALKMLEIRALRRKPYPLYVNLVINSRCNLKCVYCFGEYYARKGPEYTLEQVKEIVDALYARGTRYMLIQGGEPFLCKDLNEIIGYIHGKGIIAAVVSNGTMATRIAETPNLALLDNICFSVDGMGEGNDAQRGKGVFDRVMKAVETVKTHYPKLKIRFNSVVTKNTAGDFKKFLEFCWGKDIEVQVSLLFKEDPLAASPAEVEDINNFVCDSKIKGKKIVASSEVLKYVKDWPFDSVWVPKDEALKKLGRKAKKCQYGFYEYIVDSDGSVYPCNAMQGTFKPKNIRDGFDEALAHVQTKPCYTCNIASMLDTSEVINWNFRAIRERVFLELKR